MIEKLLGGTILMLAWAAIALMMYTGQRIALKAWAEAHAKILADRLYRQYLHDTKFRIHTGVRIIDETGGDKDDSVRNDG